MSFFHNLSQLFANQNQSPTKTHQISSPKNLLRSSLTDQKSDRLGPTSVRSVATTETTPTPFRSATSTNLPTTLKPTGSSVTVDASDIVREARTKAREIIIEAKDEALVIRSRSEKQERELIQKLEIQQRELNQKLDKIDLRLSQLDEREAKLGIDRQVIQ